MAKGAGIAARLPALAHRDFRNYQLGNFISNVGNRMQFFAILFHVFDLTHSNAYVGALGLIRVGPLVLFGLFGGVIADHFDRRLVLLFTQVGMLLVALGLFFLTITGHDSVWSLYAMVGAGAVANAFNGPARQAIVANLVPARDFPNAASINGIAWRLSDLLGPMFAGFMLAWRSAPWFSGIAWVYLLNAGSFAAMMVAIFSLAPRPPTIAERARTVRAAVGEIRQGFAFFRQAHVVRNTMIVDFWATFFAGAEALVPAFATHLAGGDPVQAKVLGGFLAAGTGIGALLASLATAFLPTFRNQGLWVLRMVGLFGLSTILFGVSPNFWVAFVALAFIGATDMVSTVLRQTIRQLSTPDSMRGRLGSIGMLFQISGPQLGDAEAGYAAEGFKQLGMVGFLGVRGSIVLGGVGSVVVAALWMAHSHLKSYDRHVEPESEAV